MHKLLPLLALVTLSAGCFGQTPNITPQSSGQGPSTTDQEPSSSSTPRNTKYDRAQLDEILNTNDYISYRHPSPNFTIPLPVGSAINFDTLQATTGSILMVQLPSITTSTSVDAPDITLYVKFAGTSSFDSEFVHATSTVKLGDRDFVYATGSDAAAGSTYRRYYYDTPWQDGHLTFLFVVRHVTDCRVYDDPAECLPFDENRDTAIFTGILAFLGDSTAIHIDALNFTDDSWVESEKYFKTTIKYPQFYIGDEVLTAFNQEIYSYVSSTASGYRMDAATLREYADEDMANPWQLEAGYDLPYVKDGMLSLLMSGYGYTGGAHGMTFYQSYLYDLKSNRLLSLSDLFKPGSDWLKQISDFCITELSLSDVSDMDWINQGAGPTLENYQTFYLAADGLHIIFGPYQVAPHAAGPQNIVIPWDALQNIIK